LKIEDIKVELKPHVGVTETAAGSIEVELPQKVIFVNDVWAGYVGDEPGAHISIILMSLPDIMLAEIKRQVDEIRGNVSRSISQAKVVDDPEVVESKSTSLDEVGL
jgi:hypothetical protein